MLQILLVIHLLIAIAMVITILLQRSEGGALGIGGGGGGGGGGGMGLFSARGSANALSRTTAILAILFFMTSIGLTLLPERPRDSGSVLDAPAATTPAEPAAPAEPSVPFSQ